MHNCKRITIFVEQFKTHIMINTTDFLNALRNFEHVAESKHLSTALKIEAKKDLLYELGKVEAGIYDIDISVAPELFDGTYHALKNL